MIIGIDPGISGAVAFVDKIKGPKVFDMPIEQYGGSSKVKNQISAAGLALLFQENVFNSTDAVAYVEKVSSMPGNGLASIFSLGQSYGTILGVLGALRIPVNIVRPNDWKKRLGLSKDKETSRTKAIHQFPNMVAQLNRKMDHNRAEALLIAFYGASNEAARN